MVTHKSSNLEMAVIAQTSIKSEPPLLLTIQTINIKHGEQLPDTEKAYTKVMQKNQHFHKNASVLNSNNTTNLNVDQLSYPSLDTANTTIATNTTNDEYTIGTKTTNHT